MVKNFPQIKSNRTKCNNFPSIGILLPFKAARLLFSVLLIGVLFSGCSSSETIIKDKKVSIEVPPVVAKITEVHRRNFDTLFVEAIDNYATDSTYYEAHQVTEKGAVVKAKLYLKDKDTQKPKLEIEVTQPDVEYSYTDTTKQTTIKEADSPSDYLVYLIILAVVIAAVILIFKFKQ